MPQEVININVYDVQEQVTINVTDEVTTVNVNIIQSTGAVSSVNGQTGTVILTADNIDDTTTTHKFVSASERTAITHSNRTILDQISEAFTTALKSTYDAAVTLINSHTANTSNPHSTTATQVDALKRDGSNANSDIDTGSYAVNAKSFKANGTGGSGHISLKHQSENATAGGQETSLFAGSDGELYYKNDGNVLAQIASRAWVGAQGFITNVVTALGYTPANKAGDTFTGTISATNLSGTNTGDETSTTIKTKLRAASTLQDGYLTQSDWNTFNGKQSALGYTAENISNKSTSVTTDQASNTKYPSVKAVFDWASSAFTTTSAVATQITTALTGYATQAYVTSQGYITNVVTALGYTPLNKAGDTLTGDLGNTSTGFIRTPNGTTAQRPASPTNGMIRYNTDTLRNEFYSNGNWRNHARLEGDTFTGAISATNLSGTNTGDETQATILSKLGYTPAGIIVKDAALSSNLTGTTSETIVKTYTIAGGALASSDVADLAIKVVKSGTVGSVTLRVYVNTAANLTGASNILQPAVAATNLFAKAIRSLTFRSGSLLVYPIGAGGLTDITNTTTAQTSVTLNPANTWYLIITLQNGSTSDTTNISEVTLRN